ncbi:MAG: hypothetical protein NW215_13040 [Hyphomicrobiales bacterium]|nr:hypothetical protein [Hyphomicrobiales bacterium]
MRARSRVKHGGLDPIRVMPPGFHAEGAARKLETRFLHHHSKDI